ncbi:hypothetical protein [Vibrio phage RYC]|nr:hypothetical protein [Vibrio phage RYC]
MSKNYIEIPKRTGNLFFIFKHAVEVSKVSGYDCVFPFNGIEVRVSADSVFDYETDRFIQEAVNFERKGHVRV